MIGFTRSLKETIAVLVRELIDANRRIDSALNSRDSWKKSTSEWREFAEQDRNDVYTRDSVIEFLDGELTATQSDVEAYAADADIANADNVRLRKLAYAQAANLGNMQDQLDNVKDELETERKLRLVAVGDREVIKGLIAQRDQLAQDLVAANDGIVRLRHLADVRITNLDNVQHELEAERKLRLAAVNTNQLLIKQRDQLEQDLATANLKRDDLQTMLYGCGGANDTIERLQEANEKLTEHLRKAHIEYNDLFQRHEATCVMLLNVQQPLSMTPEPDVPEQLRGICSICSQPRVDCARHNG